MSYQFNSIVNKNEADALKEMIFRRVRERSQSMSEDAQNDIMDIARDSFSSKNNPFSKIAEPEEKPQADEGVGFPVRRLQVKQQNKVINEQIASQTVENNMRDARIALSNKQSFMGALNFLNSQAALSLIKTRADKFEIVA